MKTKKPTRSTVEYLRFRLAGELPGQVESPSPPRPAIDRAIRRYSAYKRIAFLFGCGKGITGNQARQLHEILEDVIR